MRAKQAHQSTKNLRQVENNASSVHTPDKPFQRGSVSSQRTSKVHETKVGAGKPGTMPAPRDSDLDDIELQQNSNIPPDADVRTRANAGKMPTKAQHTTNALNNESNVNPKMDNPTYAGATSDDIIIPDARKSKSSKSNSLSSKRTSMLKSSTSIAAVGMGATKQTRPANPKLRTAASDPILTPSQSASNLLVNAKSQESVNGLPASRSVSSLDMKRNSLPAAHFRLSTMPTYDDGSDDWDTGQNTNDGFDRHSVFRPGAHDYDLPFNQKPLSKFNIDSNSETTRASSSRLTQRTSQSDSKVETDTNAPSEVKTDSKHTKPEKKVTPQSDSAQKLVSEPSAPAADNNNEKSSGIKNKNDSKDQAAMMEYFDLLQQHSSHRLDERSSEESV